MIPGKGLMLTVYHTNKAAMQFKEAVQATFLYCFKDKCNKNVIKSVKSKKKKKYANIDL